MNSLPSKYETANLAGVVIVAGSVFWLVITGARDKQVSACEVPCHFTGSGFGVVFDAGPSATEVISAFVAFRVAAAD